MAQSPGGSPSSPRTSGLHARATEEAHRLRFVRGSLGRLLALVASPLGAKGTRAGALELAVETSLSATDLRCLEYLVVGGPTLVQPVRACRTRACAPHACLLTTNGQTDDLLSLVPSEVVADGCVHAGALQVRGSLAAAASSSPLARAARVSR